MHMMPERAANVLTGCTAEEDYFNALDASVKGRKRSVYCPAPYNNITANSFSASLTVAVCVKCMVCLLSQC